MGPRFFLCKVSGISGWFFLYFNLVWYIFANPFSSLFIEFCQIYIYHIRSSENNKFLTASPINKNLRRICFSVGEILLLIALSVESGHLKNWSRPRSSCLVIRPGLFSAAGVFALTSVFLAAGLYLTALRAQRTFQDRENVRREVLEASALYASPPRSPPNQLTAIARENPFFTDNQIEHPSNFVLPLAYSYSKDPNLV